MKTRHREWYALQMAKAPHRRGPSTVGVRELRDHLSAYLDEVKAGNEIVITERGRAIAKIAPSSTASRLDQLIAAGVVTPPSRPREPSSTWGTLPADVGLLEILLEQRR